MKSILLSHVFVRKDELEKLKTIEFCLKHFRKNNPNDFIVVSGHGIRPCPKTLSMCDDYFWSDDIVEEDINVGHPNIVNKGLDILLKHGAEYVLKSRLDSIIARENTIKYCHDIISKERKRLLITTTNMFNYYMGDLFIYGKTEFIKRCWNKDSWFPTQTGLLSLGKNFISCIDEPFQTDSFVFDKWDTALKKEASYRSPHSIRWVDFRKHFDKIKSKRKVLENDFDWEPIIWQDWPAEQRYTEEIFYDDSKQKR